VTTIRTNNVKLLLPVITIFLLLVTNAHVAAAKNQSPANCSTSYENHNQIDYGPLKVQVVQGFSDMGTGSQTEAAVFGTCFALFTEKDHQLVATVSGDPQGRFEMKDVKPGRYRLVARVEGFCAANIPLEVVRNTRRKARILVHFRPTAVDTCSYGEISQ
jgi:hypothetical protein